MKNIFVALLLFVTLMSNAKGKLSPYSQAYINGHRLETAEKPSGNEILSKSLIRDSKSLTDTKVPSFITVGNDFDESKLRLLGVDISFRILNIISAQIPESSFSSVADLDGVKRIEVTPKVLPKLDKARVAANVDKLHSGAETLTMPYKGSGVVVSDIDLGFQFNHLAFYNSDMSDFRIRRVWDMDDQSSSSPRDYSYGSEYNTTDDILALSSDVSSSSHGTHVMGVAIGSYSDNNYYGIAPEAEGIMIAYGSSSISATLSRIADGVKYSFDYGTSEGKPVVVNLSQGSQLGPHDGTSTLDKIYDNLSGEGRIIVGSAGNEGEDFLHLSAELYNETDSLRTFLCDYNDKDLYLYGYCDVWSNENEDFEVTVQVIDKETGNILYKSQAISSTDKSVLIDSRLDENFKKYFTGGLYFYPESKVESNGKSNILINLNAQSVTYASKEIKYYLGLVFSSKTGASINAWTDDINTYFTSHDVDSWTQGDNICSVGEIGGTGKSIISVGSYITKKIYTNISGQSYYVYGTIGDISSFSSRGATVDGRMKPDICAPGQILVAPYNSSFYNSSSSAKSRTVDKVTYDSDDYYWGIMQGTSMSSPYVAGVIALWLQANPLLTCDDIRDVLKETSIQDTYTQKYDENTCGYGKIDAFAGLKYILGQSSTPSNIADSETMVIYPNPSDGHFSVLSGKLLYNTDLYIYTLDGTLVYSTIINTGSKVADIDVSSLLTSGVYLVTLKSDNISNTSRLLIK